MGLSSILRATDYYVDGASGSDSNNGTSSGTAYKTIQKAATVATAGSTVFIKGGTYRETVTPTNSGSSGSPITFKPLSSSDTVTISGFDQVTGSWSVHSGSIYKVTGVTASLTHDSVPRNQVLCDGKMMVNARWPNIETDIVTRTRTDKDGDTDTNDSDLARATWGSGKSSDNNGTSNDGTYGKCKYQTQQTLPTATVTDARVYMLTGLMWTTERAKVEKIESGYVFFNYASTKFDSYKMYPMAKNTFYLWDKLSLLDAAGEWYLDDANDTLYFYAPGGGSPTNVEIKTRDAALDIKGKGYLVFEDLNFVGGSCASNRYSDNNTFTRISVKYLGHFEDPVEVREDSPDNRYRYTWTLYGTNNTLQDSSFFGCAGAAVTINGKKNVVKNCVFSDVGYSGETGGAIGTQFNGTNLNFTGSYKDPSGDNGSGNWATLMPVPTALADKNTFQNNTVWRSGYRQVNGYSALDVLENDFSNSHLQLTDVGLISTWGTHGYSSEVARNFVHDSMTERDDTKGKDLYGAFGIYFDYGTSDYLVHHNVVWNVSNSEIHLMPQDEEDSNGDDITRACTDSNRRIINNTVIGELITSGQDTPGDEIINNIVQLHSDADANHTYTTNYKYGHSIDSVHLKDQDSQDFRLKSSSPCRDIGTNVSGVTTVSSNVDVGAYEGDAAPTWVAGAVISQRHLSGLTVKVETAKDGTSTVTVTGLPELRKLPADFKLLIDGTDSTLKFHTKLTADYSAWTATCIATGKLTELISGFDPKASHTLTVQIGSGTAVAPTISGTPDYRGMSVTSTAAIPTTGGTVVLTGHDFLASATATTYKRTISISGFSSEILYNYPVLVTMDTTGTHIADDGKDLRFWNGTESLPYYIESGINTTSTKIWVNVDKIPTSGVDITVTYGDSSLSAASDADKVFDFFTEFDDSDASGMVSSSASNDDKSASRFPLVKDSVVTVSTASGGKATLSGTGSWTIQCMQENGTHPENKLPRPSNGKYLIESRFKWVSKANEYYKLAAGGDDSVMALVAGGASNKKIQYYVSSTWTDISGSSQSSLPYAIADWTTTKDVGVAYTQTADNGTGTKTYDVRWMEDVSGTWTEKAKRTGIDNPAKPKFGVGTYGSVAFEAYFDRILVRQWVASGPSAGTPGSETTVAGDTYTATVSGAGLASATTVTVTRDSDTQLTLTGIPTGLEAGGTLTITITSGSNTTTYEVSVEGTDTTDPSWTSGYPKADTATSDGFTVRASINEGGKAYYVVVADGATAPSVAQVKVGQNNGGTAALKSGNWTLTASTESSTAITGLSVDADYDVYFVAEDDEATPNVQDAVTKVDVSTTTATPELIVYEKSDYTAAATNPDPDGGANSGNGYPASGNATMGVGLNGTWGTDVTVASEGLTYTDANSDALTVAGKALVFTAEGWGAQTLQLYSGVSPDPFSSYRTTADRAIDAASKEVWMSVLMKTSDTSKQALIDCKDYSGGNRFYIGLKNAKWSLMAGDASAVYSGPSATANTTALLLVKITYGATGAGSTDDKVELWVNPNLTGALGAASATYSSMNADLCKFQWRSETGSADITFDELRIGTTQASVLPTTTSLTPIESWRDTNFGQTNSAGDAADDADPDGDGIVNLMEYALTDSGTSLDPNVASTVGLPTVTVESSKLKMSFKRNTSATDVKYEIEASDDLTTWTTIAIWQAGASAWSDQTTGVTATDSSGTSAITDATELTAGTKRFLRLKVTAP
jgi:hypothetical protein